MATRVNWLPADSAMAKAVRGAAALAPLRSRPFFACMFCLQVDLHLLTQYTYQNWAAPPSAEYAMHDMLHPGVFTTGTPLSVRAGCVGEGVGTGASAGIVESRRVPLFALVYIWG